MARFIIGIDLGTSNSAVAYVEPAAGASAPVRDFPVTQLVRPGEVAAHPLLPSVISLPMEGEFPAGALSLPWATESHVVGMLARWHGARVPGRVITSAKSWLIHPGVDRQAAILPWGAAADVPQRSPVAAQAAVLKHIAQAWNHAHPDAPLAQQDVVLTLPASFDEAARALTLQAARDAGFELKHVSLLEEPSAAFYDFTSRHRTSLATALKDVRLALVVDVGGGTTDFSLVQVAMLPEGPALKRIAVGAHLLLGGDNMDAAVAQRLETLAFPDGRRFSAAQWGQAIHGARAAKEALLSDDGPATHTVSITGGGSKLVGSTLSLSLSRDDVRELVVNGFFPRVTADDVVVSEKRAGVVELGLPFTKDPAMTRHLVAFLRAHREAGHAALRGESPQQTRAGDASSTENGALPRPDAILLNGGVFNSPVLARALVDAVSALWPDAPPLRVLPHDSLDLAVARGAAYSGLARKALGHKIGGGAPRAYFVLVGTEGGKRGVCLIPRGLDEGETVELATPKFTLRLGQPVQVQLYSTTADRLDPVGAVVSLDDERFMPLPPIHTILQNAGKSGDVEVRLIASLTEVGTLALSCVSGDLRWRLEFDVRGSAASAPVLATTEAMPVRFADATIEVERVFGTKPLPVSPKDVKQLFRTLEQLLGPRDGWTLPVLREVWTALFAGISKRRRSVDHEKVMFQLLGFSLRPGSGYPLDAWRCAQTFTLFKDLLTHHHDAPVWAEFWVLWRRIASGLDETSQLAVWNFLQPHLARKVPVGLPAPKEKLKGIQPQGLDEMVRCAASLELLPVAAKVELGGWVVSRLRAPDTTGGPWAWALGRLGARVPVAKASHRVVPPEVAKDWLEVLLALDEKRHDGALFAMAQLARRTGDRARDVDDDVRTEVLRRLPEGPWRKLVSEVVALSASDEARALGDSLPVGLSLAE